MQQRSQLLSPAERPDARPRARSGGGEAPAARTTPPFTLVCGPVFTLSAHGEDITPTSRRARAIIHYLGAIDGHACSRRELAGLLWSRRAPIQAMASLRQCVHQLRAITADGVPLIVADRETIRLDRAAVSIAAPDAAPAPCLGGLDDAFDTWLERRRNAGPVPAEPPPRPAAAVPARHGPWPGRIGGRRLMVALAALIVAALAILAMTHRAPAPAPHRVAVLPFESLDAGGHGVALGEGLTEEIIGRVAAIPGVSVLGRTSVAMLADTHLNTRRLGERLRVDYVVEGAVRTIRPLVQIDVSLGRTGDGATIWSHRFQGRMQDVFAIQDEIAAAVARRVAGSGIALGPRPAAATTTGDIHALYMQARTLMHSRETPQEEAAIAMLKTATRLDPGYAPAWATLAIATRQLWFDDPSRRSEPAMIAEAMPYARRALSLSPDLAEAHAALAALAEFRGAAAEAHIVRAVAADPGNATFLTWLGHVRFEQDRFGEALAAYRRAVAAEPLSFRPALFAAGLAYATGHRDEAVADLARIAPTSPSWRYLAPEMLASLDGRFADAARLAHAAIPLTAPGSRQYGAEALADALASLGLFPLESRRGLRQDESGWAAARMRYPATPVADLFATRAALVDDGSVAYVVPRLLVRDRRPAELVAIYDRTCGSPEALVATPASLLSLVAAAVPVIQSLRAVGRAPEAARIAALLDRRVATALARPDVPGPLHAVVAQLAAVEGHADRAIGELGRAFALGYVPRVPGEDSGLLDIAREPAFAPLAGDPRFDAMRGAVLGRIARERARLAALALMPADPVMTDLLGGGGVPVRR